MSTFNNADVPFLHGKTDTMEYRHAGNEFLETEVMTASPAKLRRMTVQFALTNINRAIDDAQKSGGVQKTEATLNVREALGELLSGIKPSQDALPRQVADMYVFMLQWLTAAEADGDQEKLIDIRRVLEIELDTWDEVLRSTALEKSPVAASFDHDSIESISFDA